MKLGASELELVVLGALAARRDASDTSEIVALLENAGIARSSTGPTLAALTRTGLVRGSDGASLEITQAGVERLLALHAALEETLDTSPSGKNVEECPSVPGLTTVQTRWIDAVSVNYRVDPGALASILPAPLEPEIFKGSAWVQLLMSSLRDMRPQGLGALFGVSFYQASYRAAVRYKSPGYDGGYRRGGYFVRSETNHPVMRAVGNKLVEFKFHEFGGADMMMLRDGGSLKVGVDPAAAFPHGRVFGAFDTSVRSEKPPAASVWTSLGEMQGPLVECYDAFGIDRENGWMYVLTIDREPWNARFVTPTDLYAEYFDTGPLGGGRSQLDSVLHIEDCPYKWRPLRRERLTP